MQTGAQGCPRCTPWRRHACCRRRRAASRLVRWGRGWWDRGAELPISGALSLASTCCTCRAQAQRSCPEYPKPRARAVSCVRGFPVLYTEAAGGTRVRGPGPAEKGQTAGCGPQGPGSQRQSGAGRSPPTAGVLLATPRMCLCVGGVVRRPPWACPPAGRAPTPGTCVSPYDPQVPEQ